MAPQPQVAARSSGVLLLAAAVATAGLLWWRKRRSGSGQRAGARVGLRALWLGCMGINARLARTSAAPQPGTQQRPTRLCLLVLLHGHQCTACTHLAAAAPLRHLSLAGSSNPLACACRYCSLLVQSSAVLMVPRQCPRGTRSGLCLLGCLLFFCVGGGGHPTQHMSQAANPPVRTLQGKRAHGSSGGQASHPAAARSSKQTAAADAAAQAAAAAPVQLVHPSQLGLGGRKSGNPKKNPKARRKAQAPVQPDR